MRNVSNGVELPPVEFEKIEGLEVRELPPIEGLIEFKSASSFSCQCLECAIARGDDA